MRETLSEATSLDDDGIKFETSFNIRHIVGIAGFKVELTSNLSDHLRFRDSDRTVKIFHHASSLESRRKYVDRNAPLPFYFQATDNWCCLEHRNTY